MKCSYCGGKTTEPICVCCGKPVHGNRQQAEAVSLLSFEEVTVPVTAGTMLKEKVQQAAGRVVKKTPAQSRAKATVAAGKSTAKTSTKPAEKTAAKPKTSTAAATPAEKNKPEDKKTQPAKPAAAPAQKAAKKPAAAQEKARDTTAAQPEAAAGGTAAAALAVTPATPALQKTTQRWLGGVSQGKSGNFRGMLMVFYIWECIQMIAAGLVMLVSSLITVVSFVNVVWDIIAGGGDYDLTLREGIFSSLLVLILIMMISLYVYKINQAVVNRMNNRQGTFLIPYYIYNLSNILLAFLSYYIFYTSAGNIYFVTSGSMLIYPTVYFAANAAVSVAWVVYLFLSPQVNALFRKTEENS